MPFETTAPKYKNLYVMNYAFIIRFILYHFVDFHAFDTHLFHRQDYHRIKLRLMIAVAIVVDFEKFDNFHCLPCKKNQIQKITQTVIIRSNYIPVSPIFVGSPLLNFKDYPLQPLL